MSEIYSFKGFYSSTVGSQKICYSNNDYVIDNSQSNNNINNEVYSYNRFLPENLNVLKDAFDRLVTIHNPRVRKNTEKILDIINRNLVRYSNVLSNKFNEILLSEMEDESVLIEWNFEKLRVGFAIEVDDKESSYYIIENDVETGRISTVSNLIQEKNYTIVIPSILDYLVRNT